MVHTYYLTTKIEAAGGGQGIFLFIDWFVLFVFKMGDIRTHLLPYENSLGKRERVR